MNSSWTLCVSLRFSSAFPRVALRGRMPAVSLERVAARKKVPAVVAEGDIRVRLRVAMPLEVLPRLERWVGSLGTAPALDLANRATRPVACVAASSVVVLAAAAASCC